VIEKFMSNVEIIPEAGCWIWMGALTGAGYGSMRLSGAGRRQSPIAAHRFSYESFIGPIGGLQVLHRCDITCCVNPAHLFIGTPQANMTDKVSKSRQNKSFTGEQYRKLSPEDHLTIAGSMESSKQQAKKYGVHYTHINWIRRKERKKVQVLVA
jgi:hypothetical protein